MQFDPLRITDGLIDLNSGADSGRSPSTIPRNACALAINVTMRGSFAGTRPGFRKHTLTFQDEERQEAFESGNLQVASYYQYGLGEPLLVAMVSGRVYSINREYEVVELTGTDRKASNLPLGWMEQAEQYLVIQDGQSRPFIFDGSGLRRATQDEVPVGTAMAYGIGRLAVARDRLIFFGDINGGAASVITFKETQIVALGGAYTIATPGNITALKFFPVLDSSTGQGELTAHTPYGITTFRVAAPRDLWKTMEGFQRVAYQPFGSASQSITLINSDIWYRARDGMRSLSVGVRNNVSTWLNAPQSKEMARIIKKDDRRLLPYAQSMLFDNRALFTVSPVMTGGRVYHRGLAVIDFDPVSNLVEKTPPHWEYIWTGLKFTKLVTGDFDGIDRAFMFAIDKEDRNVLWELSYDDPFDNTDRRIECHVEGASYFFQNIRERKRLEAGELFVDDLDGTVNFTLIYRPDQSPDWYDWKTWQICATTSDCSLTNGCQVPKNLKRQYRSRLWAEQPQQVCEVGQKKPSREAYQFQPRISWTGKARIKGLFIHAMRLQENPYGNGCETESCESVDTCDLDPFSYDADP